MTFKELTYSCLEILSGYNITDDEPISIKQIEEVLLQMNATLVREAYTNKRLSQSLYLTDANLPVQEMVDVIEVQGVNVSTTNKFCIAQLKQLVQGIAWKDVIYVGPTDFSIIYHRKTFRGLINGDNSAWTLPTPAYAISEDKVYLEQESLSGARYISVKGIWRDPREVTGYDENMDFPTPSEYRMQLLTIQHLLTGKNVPPDLVNDAQRQIGMPRRNAQPNPRTKREEVKERE